jgi:hypothetical protein
MDDVLPCMRRFYPDITLESELTVVRFVPDTQPLAGVHVAF